MTTTIYRRKSPPDRALLKTGAPYTDEPNVRRDTIVRDEDNGEALLYVGQFPGDLGAYRRALLEYPADTVARMAGTHNNSRSFGFLARSVVFKRNGCRSCFGSQLFPAAHATICAASSALAEALVAAVPERAGDYERASDIRDEWKVGGWWTSGVVNYDSPMPYHFDANNHPCWSAMPVVRRGHRGGYLHIPQIDAFVECRDGDVVYFAGYDLMHAVTPIRRKGGSKGRGSMNGYRISAVYYTVSGVRNCLSVEEELERGRRDRSVREDTLIERQRADGMIGAGE